MAGPGSVRWPLLAAVLAATTVVLAVVLSRPAEETLPLPVDPAPPDRTALSLSRCATAVILAGRMGEYPDAAQWRPVASTAEAGVVVTIVDGGPLPFACATGPITVDVSDPRSAVPVGPASLLLTDPPGVVALAAPPGSGVTVSVAGAARPPAPYVTVAAGAPVTVDGVPLTARVPAAVHAVDRRVVPEDRSIEARTLLERCRLVATPDRFWATAQVLALPGGTDLLVVTASAAVGGCVVPPGAAGPVLLWRVGATATGSRPFVWLPTPGSVLPGLDAAGLDAAGAVAAGPVQNRLVRMEIRDTAGRVWSAAVGGGTFVTRLPDGVDPDPRTLAVRAFDADDRLIYDGPAAG